jgi:DNA-binding NarL/FixJ family response regulator
MDIKLPQVDHAAETAPKHVVVVDPSPVILEAISMFLDIQPDLDVVARAHSSEELLNRLKPVRGRSTLALVAMELTGKDDVYSLIHALRERHPTVRIAAFGAVIDRMSISRALFVGADGFIDKRANPIQFLDGIRKILGGEMVLAGVPRDWLGPIASSIEKNDGRPTGLTPRETEILRVAAEGLTAREIAVEIGLAERTVTTHLANIYSKLEVGTRVAAVMKAANLGLINIDVRSLQNSRADAG